MSLYKKEETVGYFHSCTNSSTKIIFDFIKLFLKTWTKFAKCTSSLHSFHSTPGRKNQTDGVKL